MVDHIAPRTDTLNRLAGVKASFDLAIPKPILYYNYHVGECQDLIFGVSLTDYATARGLPEGDIPRIVKLCIAYIDERGLKAEGIYRVSPLMRSCVHSKLFMISTICQVSGRLAVVQEVSALIV